MKTTHHLPGLIGLLCFGVIVLGACRLRTPNGVTPTETVGPPVVDAAMDTSVPLKTVPAPIVTNTPGVSPVPMTDATPKSTIELSSTAVPSGTGPIVVRAMAGAEMLKPALAVVSLKLEGLNSAKEDVRENLRVERLTTDKLHKQSVVVTGTLATRTLEGIYHQTLPYQMDSYGIYRSDNALYWQVHYKGLKAASCQRLEEMEQDPLRGDTPPEIVLHNLQTAWRGQLLGEEKVNGAIVQHFRIDATASNQAGQALEDLAARTRSTQFPMVSGDIYVAVEGSTLVKAILHYKGVFADYGINGSATINYDFSHPRAEETVKTPDECLVKATSGEDPKTIGEATRLEFGVFNARPPAGQVASVITLTMKGEDLMENAVNGNLLIRYAENLTSQRRFLSIEGIQKAKMLDISDEDSATVSRIAVYKIGNAFYIYSVGTDETEERCSHLGDKMALNFIEYYRPDMILGWVTNGYRLYGVPEKPSTQGSTMTTLYTLDVAALNQALHMNTQDNNSLPKLVGGTGTMARRHFSAAELIDGTTPDGRDLNYLQHLKATYDGYFTQFELRGRLQVTYEFSLPVAGIDITLPRACLNAPSS